MASLLKAIDDLVKQYKDGQITKKDLDKKIEQVSNQAWEKDCAEFRAFGHRRKYNEF